MNWRINLSDKTYEAESAAENEIYRLAKLEALTNHALRFSCAVHEVVSLELIRTRKHPETFFNRFKFQKNLEPVRPTLNLYCEGNFPLDKTEIIMRPFVTDGLRGMPPINSLILTREALITIGKIQI